MPLNCHREFVTVAKALQYLASNTTNRSLVKSQVENFARDMRQGRWQETHQAIAFDDQGNLKDGQHRLSAIVASGCPQWLFVCDGLDQEANKVVDCGRARTIADSLTMEGEAVTPFQAAIGRRMLVGMPYTTSRRYFTRVQYMDAIQFYWEAINFVGHKHRSVKPINASVGAVIARAWYTCDHNRLRKFIDCLESATVACEADGAASSLYRAIVNRKSAKPSNLSCVHDYNITCSALLAFLDGRPLHALRQTTIEPFPIPLPPSILMSESTNETRGNGEATKPKPSALRNFITEGRFA